MVIPTAMRARAQGDDPLEGTPSRANEKGGSLLAPALLVEGACMQPLSATLMRRY